MRIEREPIWIEYSDPSRVGDWEKVRREGFLRAETHGFDGTAPFDESEDAWHGVVMAGRIKMFIPGINMYKVAIDQIHSDEIICSDGRAMTGIFDGASGSHYSSGEMVVVFVHTDNFGVILGSMPMGYGAKEGVRQSINDVSLWQGTFSAKKRESTKPFLDQNGAMNGLVTGTYNRPADWYPGDVSNTSIFGGSIHTDPFLTMIRCTPVTGIYMFTLEDVMKLLAKLYMMWSWSHNWFIGLDEAEPYDRLQSTTYLWENWGYYKKQTSIDIGDVPDPKEGFDLDEQLKEANECAPFYRNNRYTGFLGQGLVEFQRIPPKDAGDKFQKDSDHPLWVARRQIGIDGTYVVESSKGIFFFSNGNISRGFTERYEINDEEGDNIGEDGGYDPNTPDNADPPEDDATNTDKIVNAIFQRNKGGFKAHTKDFEKIPDDERLFEHDVKLISISQLQGAEKLKPEEQAQTQAYVDHDQTSVKYIGVPSTTAMFDGKQIIRGGCGEEIRMEGGNIHISCPGKIYIDSAKTVAVQAGDDIDLRAKNSIDITSVKKDVRIKAHFNMEIVGGVSEQSGRVLVECQAPGSPTVDEVDEKEGEDIQSRGLVLKSKGSATTLADSIGLRTVSDSGEIFLDASDGKGRLLTHSAYKLDGVRQFWYQGDYKPGGGDSEFSFNDPEKPASFIYVDTSMMLFGTKIVAVNDWSDEPTPINFLVEGALRAEDLYLFEGEQSEAGNIICRHINILEGTTRPVYTNEMRLEEVLPKEDGPVPDDFKDTVEELIAAEGPLTELTWKMPNDTYYDGKDKESQKNHHSLKFNEKEMFSFRTSEQYDTEDEDCMKTELYWTELWGWDNVESTPKWEETTYKYQKGDQSEGIDQNSYPGYKTWEEEERVEVGKSKLYKVDGSDGDYDPEDGGGGSGEKKIPKDYFRSLAKN